MSLKSANDAFESQKFQDAIALMSTNAVPVPVMDAMNMVHNTLKEILNHLNAEARGS